MKIKTRVKIAGALSVCVLLAYGGWAIYRHREINRLTHELQEAQKITNKIFLLQALSNDYLSFPMARAQMQWSAVYEELLRLLDEPEYRKLQGNYGIADTADSLKSVELTFFRLRRLQETSGRDAPEAAPPVRARGSSPRLGT